MLDVCRFIRSAAADSYTDLIMLTGQGLMQDVIEGFDAGADDYITKPFEVRELQASVRSGARTVELREQLVESREPLRIQATHDSLTGLLNRAAFFEAFRLEGARPDWTLRWRRVRHRSPELRRRERRVTRRTPPRGHRRLAVRRAVEQPDRYLQRRCGDDGQVRVVRFADTRSRCGTLPVHAPRPQPHVEVA